MINTEIKFNNRSNGENHPVHIMDMGTNHSSGSRVKRSDTDLQAFHALLIPNASFYHALSKTQQFTVFRIQRFHVKANSCFPEDFLTVSRVKIVGIHTDIRFDKYFCEYQAMYISTSNLSMNAESSFIRIERLSSSMSIRDRSSAASARPDNTETARPNDDISVTDMRLILLKLLIEQLTGRDINLSTINSGKETEPLQPPDQVNENTITLELRHIRFVDERVSFSASGTVTTSDGRVLSFRIGFDLSRTELESTRLQVVAEDDPLVLDFGQQGASVTESGVAFDINNDGVTEDLPKVSGRGYLIFDRNVNGIVDNAFELFGPATGNGWAELRQLDSDGNGWIDEAEPAFRQLAVWQPGTAPQPLIQAGIGALYTGLVATPWRVDGDSYVQMRSSGLYLSEDGTPGTISRIDLEV